MTLESERKQSALKGFRNSRHSTDSQKMWRNVPVKNFTNTCSISLYIFRFWSTSQAIKFSRPLSEVLYTL